MRTPHRLWPVRSFFMCMYFLLSMLCLDLFALYYVCGFHLFKGGHNKTGNFGLICCTEKMARQQIVMNIATLLHDKMIGTTIQYKTR